MARPDPIPGTTISVRVPDDIAAEVVAIARVESVSISEVIRAGIHRHLAWLRADPEFQKRLRARLHKDREILERYGERSGREERSRCSQGDRPFSP
ncbi:MAG: ribbon-helix-helix protein, CopG family [Solirubrobacterales bacterium]